MKDSEVEGLEGREKELFRLQMKQEQQREILEDEAAAYAELGQMKAKYEERNQLQEQLVEEKEQLRIQKAKVERLEDDLD